MKRRVAIAAILIMGILWAAADLGSKHWVQLHLATPMHLLPVTIANGQTICKAYKNKLGIKDCEKLKNKVYEVEGPLKVKKGDSLKKILVDHPLLFAFLKDKGFAVRLHIWQDTKKPTIKTIDQALNRSLKLNGEETRKILATEIFGIRRGKGPVSVDRLLKKAGSTCCHPVGSC